MDLSGGGWPASLEPEGLDASISAGAEETFAFLERLVATPSVLGKERAAQDLVAARLAGLQFNVERLPIPQSVADEPHAGVAQLPYSGRDNVVGRRRRGEGPSLLLNGHIDVVPADRDDWGVDPFEPVLADGWLIGRGAGDMKGGLAMGILALAALDSAVPGWQTGEVTFLTVIEEECTGNGTLAAARAGVLADAAVLLEPTDLGLLLGGVGILWVEISVPGRAAHAESADRAVNPLMPAIAVLSALRTFEQEMNDDHRDGTARDEAFVAVDHPYNVNVGSFHAGNWPSSVPGAATLGVRVGFPRHWSPGEAFDRVRDVVAQAARTDDWLAAHPPTLRRTGFRAEGYALPPSHPLVEALASAHFAAHGVQPRRFTMGSTTDARFYVNQFDTPALAFGPRTRNIHGAGEAVELASIVAGARTLARFLLAYFARPAMAP